MMSLGELSSNDEYTKAELPQNVCVFCNKSFKYQSTLRHHEQIHYGIKKHECETCHRRFLHKGTLKCHLRLHTGETPYKCPHCPKSFRGQTALNCHIFRHTKQGVSCPKCSMVFATSSIVKQHLKQVHTFERAHICNMCGVTYKHLKSLKIHLNSHQKRACPDCGAGFDSVYAMQRHHKRHIEQSLAFRCQFCNRAFEKDSELKRHERLRGRHFQCEICCHSFNKSNYLVNHNRRVHWKTLGLERLRVSEPKNGWNRKGILKLKRGEKLPLPVLTEESEYLSADTFKEFEDHDHGHLLAKEQAKTHHRQIAYDKPTNDAATVEYQNRLLGTGKDRPTEIVFVEQSDVPDLKIRFVDENVTDDSLVTERNKTNKENNRSETKHQSITNNDNSSEEGTLCQCAHSECSFCNRLFAKTTPLRQRKCVAQKNTNPTPGPLICELCGNWYASTTTLMIHQTNQHHTQRFQCDQCDRGFGFRCYLEKHIRTHHQNERITCERCDKSFKYVQDLKVHLRHHDEVKPYKCDQCPAVFRFPSALRCHKLLHQKQFPFACDICDKRFRFDNSLRVHKRLHVGIKQYKCEVCDREFSTKAPMLRHMKIHDKGKQFSCVVCKVVFYRKVDLAIHESKEHLQHEAIGKRATIYTCEYCGKEFIKKSNLKAHCYIHEKVHRFQCLVCSRSFKQHAGLKAHLKSAHK